MLNVCSNSFWTIKSKFFALDVKYQTVWHLQTIFFEPPLIITFLWQSSSHRPPV